MKALVSTRLSGILHSLLGMLSDPDPKVKNLTESLKRIPYVPAHDGGLLDAGHVDDSVPLFCRIQCFPSPAVRFESLPAIS